MSTKSILLYIGIPHNCMVSIVLNFFFILLVPTIGTSVLHRHRFDADPIRLFILMPILIRIRTRIRKPPQVIGVFLQVSNLS
jgi:hypothetical protein